MDYIFNHIDQTKYILKEIFETGYSSLRGIEHELNELQQAASKIGLARGSELISNLIKNIIAYKGGSNTVENLLSSHSALLSYYNLLLKILILNNIKIN